MDAAIMVINTTVTNTVKAFDSNYAATYYPWVKILDTDIINQYGYHHQWLFQEL